MVLILMVISFFSYIFYGPYFSPDTVNYFNFSTNFFIDNYWTEIYSPFYPFILLSLNLLPFLSLFTAANLLILIQYGLTLYFLYQLAKNISDIHRFHSISRTTLILLFLITCHSWWSFRIITWAHADATFYVLLITYFYFLTQYTQSGSVKYLLIFSILGATLIWVKLNALALVPFLLLLFLFDKQKTRWLVPLCFTTASYFAHRFVFPQNLFDTQLDNKPYSVYLSLESFELLGRNMDAFFKTTLGFFLSDPVTAYIPQPIAIFGAILIIICLLFVAIGEIKKGLAISSLFLLYGLVYLLCLLTFQQMAFFEEINYRTLFPFFIPCSWFLWVKWINFGKRSWIPILMVGFLMTSHTVVGHLWLWNRQDVNSLFEVGKLMESEMVVKIQNLQTLCRESSLFSDRPEKLALVFNNPFVEHYNPATIFIHGKRRTVNPLERQRNLDLIKGKLLKGEAILVLFGEDENLNEFARKNGLLKLDYQEGTVFLKNPTP